MYPQEATKKILKLFSFPDSRESGRDAVFLIVTLILTVIILLIPTGFERHELYSNAVRVKVRILEVDNSLLRYLGVVNYGSQKMEIEILSGDFKGEIYSTSTTMTGSLDRDKLFEEGDIAYAEMNVTEDGRITIINIQDHYRTDKTIILASLFTIVTIIVMGWTGVKIIITFVFAMAMLVKILYPLTLIGFDPIIGGLIVTLIITAFIILLVGGLTRRGTAAFLGAASGVIFTAIISFIFSALFKITGGVQQFSQNLTYMGFEYLNLAHLFIAGVFIAASGAIMDMSMNVAATMDEIKVQQPDISRMQLMKSGFIVGRQAAGTMTTTLLLAYSAEYTAMIMFFIAQGFPFENIINMLWVSSEVIHTLVGCFGLTLVAPFTVLAGGLLLGKGSKQ